MFCAPDETKKPLRGFVNWNRKICVFWICTCHVVPLNNVAPPSENERGEQNGLMNSNPTRAGKCPLSWEQEIDGCKRPSLRD